ncbi:MAG: 5-methyltetrahydropteroyltriglutamate--homocysteine S-methyltransferase [Thermoguttaceae bacterium]|jgi:5-methyltetrahydropteroyltriglutamate--homocysteine methyltransferase
MALSSILGLPRIGSKRELKWAIEGYWQGDVGLEELQAAVADLRRRRWQLARDRGIEQIPCGDFSLYDHVLDTVAMVGAVPPRFQLVGGPVDLATYFALARGTAEVAPLDMTKWFDTNYHYLVPEFEARQTFRLASTAPIDAFCEALALGIRARPVLLGPVSFLLLGKPKGGGHDPLALLDRLVPVYEEVLRRLADAGAEWVQIDEPALVCDLPAAAMPALATAVARLSGAAPQLKICLATYFGDLGENLSATLDLPVAAVHLDLVRAPGQLRRALELTPQGLMLSLGVVNGRNIWRTDFEPALELLERAAERLGPGRILVAPSCSLLHCPIDVDLETGLDAELKGWLAFAHQKLDEVSLLTRAINEGRPAVADALAENRALFQRRRQSGQIHNAEVKERLAAISPDMLSRKSPYAERRKAQAQNLSLPLLPTTTIGSFPQTAEVRRARAALKKGDWSREQYETFCRQEIERTVRLQEQIDLDVLVHGESERNDMVEYFGEQLDGFAFTRHGWVQSYGTRCVKPPIIYGDVRRPKAMTVAWSQYAQSLTRRPMKGMLTGPVTILQWSFVRDDQPRRDTAFQIALAIRDEVLDLERAGIRVIQIDEPALREGLPLRRHQRDEYLRWAVDAFRLSAAGVADQTQIHTHMCYAEFNDIIQSIAALDADAISIEASRSDMDLLEAFARFQYPNEIGPGVYDIHSPRVPEVEEIMGRLQKALRHLRPEQLWVNPDCGLKTRGWPEVQASLRNMVEATKRLRKTVGNCGHG